MDVNKILGLLIAEDAGEYLATDAGDINGIARLRGLLASNPNHPLHRRAEAAKVINRLRNPDLAGFVKQEERAAASADHDAESVAWSVRAALRSAQKAALQTRLNDFAVVQNELRSILNHDEFKAVIGPLAAAGPDESPASVLGDRLPSWQALQARIGSKAVSLLIDNAREGLKLYNQQIAIEKQEADDVVMPSNAAALETARQAVSLAQRSAEAFAIREKLEKKREAILAEQLELAHLSELDASLARESRADSFSNLERIVGEG